MKTWMVAIALAFGVRPGAYAAGTSLDALLAQPELAARDAVTQASASAFMAGDFATIERYADEARSRALRTPSGLWVSGLVGSGIDEVANFHSVRDDAAWDALEAIGRRWLAAYPQSTTAQVAYGQLLQNRAWFYRGGGGYADSVSDAQFAAFHRQVEKSRKYLSSVRASASADPLWYLQYLAALRLGDVADRAEFEHVFDASIRRFPDYFPLYFEAVTYYFPKWNGDAAEVEDFARRVMRGRDERSGRMLYARIYWYASQSQFKGRLFERSAVVWDDMRAGFRTILADFPDPWNVNNYARFACLAGDREALREAFQRIAGKPLAAAWDSREQYRACSAKLD